MEESRTKETAPPEPQGKGSDRSEADGARLCVKAEKDGDEVSDPKQIKRGECEDKLRAKAE